MNRKEGFLSLFPTTKPILGMIHLKGESRKEKLDRAILEAKIMIENGINAVIVENYFGDADDVEAVLKHFYDSKVSFIYGVNVLKDDKLSFELAGKYGAKFIQLDSVAGHLELEDDKRFEEFIADNRSKFKGYVLGGVRFKYQPYKSGRSLEEDLLIGKKRCDAIVVTGEGTGMITSLEKISEFRKNIGEFPLIVGAGMTPDTCKEQFGVADGAIVGSYLKDEHLDKGNIVAEYIKEFMDAVNEIRRSEGSVK